MSSTKLNERNYQQCAVEAQEPVTWARPLKVYYRRDAYSKAPPIVPSASDARQPRQLREEIIVQDRPRSCPDGTDFCDSYVEV